MTQTAMELDLEEGDAIDVFYDQDGGLNFPWKKFVTTIYNFYLPHSLDSHNPFFVIC